MSFPKDISSLSRERRDHEAKSLKVFLAYSLPCSLILHIIALTTIQLTQQLVNPPLDVEDAIEVVIVDTPEEKIAELQTEPREEVLEAFFEQQQESVSAEPVALAPSLSNDRSEQTPITSEIAPPLKPSAENTSTQEPKPENIPTSTEQKDSATTQPDRAVISPNQILEGNQPTTEKLSVGGSSNSDAISRIRNLLRGSTLGGTGNSRSGTNGNGNFGLGNAGSGNSGTGRNGSGDRGNSSASPSTGSGNAASSNNDRSSRVRCRECAKPDYPSTARNRGLEGQAKVAVDVDGNGHVISVRLLNSSGHAELDEAAIQAARKWKFSPSAAGQQGIPAKVDFQLEGSEYAQRSQAQRQQREQERLPEIPAPTGEDTAKVTPPPTNTINPNPDSPQTPPAETPPPAAIVTPNPTNNVPSETPAPAIAPPPTNEPVETEPEAIAPEAPPPANELPPPPAEDPPPIEETPPAPSPPEETPANTQ